MSGQKNSRTKEATLADPAEDSSSFHSRPVSASPVVYIQDTPEPGSIPRVTEPTTHYSRMIHSPGQDYQPLDGDMQRGASVSPLSGDEWPGDVESRMVSSSYPTVCGNLSKDRSSATVGQDRDMSPSAAGGKVYHRDVSESVRPRERSPRGSGGASKTRSSAKSLRNRSGKSAGSPSLAA